MFVTIILYYSSQIGFQLFKKRSKKYIYSRSSLTVRKFTDTNNRNIVKTGWFAYNNIDNAGDCNCVRYGYQVPI